MISRAFLRGASSGALALAALTAAGRAQAPDGKANAGTAKLLQADFAVPDAPALKLLDADASKLLRPVSAQALTAALSNATGDFSYIPRAFAVEFSPGMLANGERLTLEEYKKGKYWYRTRLSVATKRDSGANARTQIAAAVRIALHDDSDLRTNDHAITTILALTKWQVDSGVTVTHRLMAARVPTSGTLTPQQEAKKREIIQQVAVEHAQEGKKLAEAFKRAQEDATWNANVFDIAFGIQSSAADSTGAGLQFDGVAGWLTQGLALGHGRQLLLGARGAFERDVADTMTTDLKGTFDVALRMYVGSNRYKALGEIQATGRETDGPKWLGKVGGELHLTDALWIDASVGYQAEGKLSEGKVITAFKLKFTPPGS